MKPALYRLEERHLQQLKDLKERTGIAEAEYVRQALDTYLPFLAEEGTLAEALAQARLTYDDAQTSPHAIHRMAAGWLHDRESNSKRGAIARLEAELMQLKSDVAEMKLILRRLSNMMEPGK